MFSTLLLVALFLAVLTASVVLWAMCLRLGLRWAKVEGATTRRIVWATAAIVLLEIVFRTLFSLRCPSTNAQAVAFGLVELVVRLLVTWRVIMWVFKTSFLRSAQAWLPTLIVSVAQLLLAFCVIRPFVCEAFTVSGNSMAPTLLAEHWRGMCPKCGKRNYCSPVPPEFGRAEPTMMICDNFHACEISAPRQNVFACDRFLVAKFLSPRRWDMVVFQRPDDPAVVGVKRIVGLPGETIEIKNGAVWANGKRLSPPECLAGIEYASDIPGLDGPIAGAEQRPATLGEDEYFVLGDFSLRSMDSRLWHEGVPGHPPFAVPRSYLRGVVTHVYWPPERWRAFR